MVCLRFYVYVFDFVKMFDYDCCVSLLIVAFGMVVWLLLVLVCLVCFTGLLSALFCFVFCGI